MKARHRLLSLLFISVSFSGNSLATTNQYWNAGGVGGDGNWGTSPGDKNWNTTLAGPLPGNTFWADPTDDIAVFQDALGGTVTVFDPVQTAGIIQNGANYSINAGTITLVQDAAMANPFINVASGTLTIDATLDGTHGLIKTGGGNLLLTTANLYTGATTVQTGTLTLGGNNLTDAAVVNLSNGAILSLSGADTIGTLNSNGTIAGTGTLTATTYNLDAGTSVTGHLGLGTLNSNGAVGITGIADALTVNVQTGTLTLGGNNLADAAIVNLSNGAILSLSGADTIGTLNSNGTIAGTGILTATTYNLDAGTSVTGHLGLGTLNSNGAVGITGIADALTVNVQTGTLTLGGNNLADAAIVNLSNGAILSLSGADTIGILNSNGTIAGTGTLTATTYNLDAGTSVTGHLGLGTLNSNGAVGITGIADALTVNVQTGTLTLGGNNLADAATVNVSNGSILSLSGADTIGTLNSNGTIAGTGILTAATYNLDTGTSVTGHLGLGTLNSNGAVGITGIADALTVNVQTGTLTLGGNNLADAATVNVSNGSILSLSGADTIGILNSNGTIAGTGILTAATYNLDAGTSVTGHLGLGTLNSNGAVGITGIADALTVNVLTGTLTLGGNNLADAAIVNLSNGAILSLSGADTIGTLNSNGTIAGTGTLTATTYNLDAGTSVTGHLGLGTLNSNGAVGITGIADALTVNVQTGTLTLGGNNLADAAIVNLSNGAILSLSGADTIGTLNSNGTIAGTGILTATTYNLDAGTSVTGHLGLGTLNSNGAVGITGIADALTVNVQTGTLTLGGNNLADAAIVNLSNGAILSLSGADTIGTLNSNGTIAGTGILTAATYNLDTGTSVTGHLGLGTLNSNGAVGITGIADALDINIQTGTLTNTGTLGTALTHLDIAGGATLTASGTQNYALLTTSGSGTGNWQGNLSNIIAPGGAGGIGTLRVNGNFANTPGGMLKFDISAADHDLIDVTGSASFAGTLDLNQVGTTAIAPFVPINLVHAGSYSGNFTTLTENLDGVVWFNPGNGSVTRINVPTGTGKTLFGTTANQTSSWIALYDDVIEPGVTNITYTPGGNPGYHITGGIADGDNPDLLWALAASFTSTGLDTNLLNRLSPEVYASFQDYAVQATRTHQRTALSAPALAASPQATVAADAKGGGKEALPAISHKPSWEIFAATDYFNVATTNSDNHADYELSGQGVMAGVRVALTDRVKLAGYFAGDDGEVNGSLIDADATGWSLGLLGEVMIDRKSSTRLTAGISYGGYAFEGSRGSASATAADWTPGGMHWHPGGVGFHDVDSDSWELFLGMEGVVYQNDRFRLIPSIGLRYANGSMDSFTESTGTTPGSPIALEVNRDHYHSALGDIAILAEADVTADLTLWARLGATGGLGEQSHSITGHFEKGARTLRAEADGLSNDYWFIGVGARYRINDSISVGIGFRSEFRSDADNQNTADLSASFRF